MRQGPEAGFSRNSKDAKVAGHKMQEIKVERANPRTSQLGSLLNFTITQLVIQEIYIKYSLSLYYVWIGFNEKLINLHQSGCMWTLLCYISNINIKIDGGNCLFP